VTSEYRDAAEDGRLAPLPENLASKSDSIHKLIGNVFDDTMLESMVEDGNETRIPDNELNDNFYRKEFQELWHSINHKYAYRVDFDSEELLKKAVTHIDANLKVTELQYTITQGEQTDDMDADALERGEAFDRFRSGTRKLDHSEGSKVHYDLIGKIAEGTTLTRRTTARILSGIAMGKLYLFKVNPEEFITKAITLINEQKATMIIEGVSYNMISGIYDSDIFTAEKHSQGLARAFLADKHIQDYVFTDGTAEKSVEKRFAEDLEKAEEVCVYAKLPKRFHIPTPVGNYTPDWAIAFNKGMVKHIFFIAETKGTMSSFQMRPIERAKISCARKLFNEMSTSNVKYHDVDSYQNLLNIMGAL
jgi:type III restriction enzyme